MQKEPKENKNEVTFRRLSVGKSFRRKGTKEGYLTVIEKGEGFVTVEIYSKKLGQVVGTHKLTNTVCNSGIYTFFG